MKLARRRAVAFSGDPSVSWSIALLAGLTGPLDLAAARQALSAVCTDHPGLGPVPELRVVPDARWDATRAAFVDDRYLVGDSLVRVAYRAGPTPRLMVAAHHTALDGLGILSLIGSLIGDPSLRSSVGGLAGRAAGGRLPLVLAGRIAEAVFRPPLRPVPLATRRARPARTAGGGDLVLARTIPAVRMRTAILISLAHEAIGRWSGRPHARMTAAIGASWRGGDDLAPDCRSALLRIRLPRTPDRTATRHLLAEQPPEPLPNPSPSGPERLLSTVVTTLLARRLGSTVLVSNLGEVSRAAGSTAPIGLTDLELYPVAGGRPGLTVGAVTGGGHTTITLRARGDAVDPDSGAQLLDYLVTLVRAEAAGSAPAAGPAAGACADAADTAEAGVPAGAATGPTEPCSTAVASAVPEPEPDPVPGLS
jgi:hypothetical protein